MKPQVTQTQATEPQPRSVILGTAGHIDHGKTALVRALTGTDTDRLPEEKSRGITIDLGFAALELTGADGQRFEVSLIDVPGHHAFVRNMLAGAGGIDCVLLVVAADEGVRAQTREHLEICRLLGLARGLVVLTKSDLVSAERLAAAREEVAELVRHTFLQDAPFYAVSAFTGQGLAALQTALTELVAAVPARNAELVARLPLDRAFSVRGFGTVVTGTLQAGQLHAEQMLQMGDRTVRVRGVQVHNRPQSLAAAPNRVALNLPGIEVGEVRRGDTLVEPGTLAPTCTVDVELAAAEGVELPKHRARVRLHAFTSETLATVLRYAEGAEAMALVRLRLDKPVVLAPGDRFVLRQPSPARTVAGGRVLDATPLPRQRKAGVLAWLQQVQSADRGTQLLLRVGRRGVAGSTVHALVEETGLTLAAVRGYLEPLLVTGRVVTDARGTQGAANLLTREALGDAVTIVSKELMRAKGQPTPAAELRSRTRLSAWVFGLTLERIGRDRRLVQTAQGVALEMQGAAGPGASPGDVRVEQLYARAGLAAPIFSEAAAQLGMQAAALRTEITALLRAGRLVRLGSDDLLVHAGALARLTGALQKHRGEQFDVARFKSFTGLTRKHAIPLLEWLDGARVLRNSHGVRTVL